MKNSLKFHEILLKINLNHKNNYFYLLMSSLAQTVVIDNGDGLIKAGFAGSDSPTTVFSTRIGKSKENTFIGNFKENDLMDISYPIERQTIKNWEDMEIIWKYTFDKLGIKSEEHPLLIT